MQLDCGCEGPENTPMHRCPYNEEMGGVEECNCCLYHVEQCARDI